MSGDGATLTVRVVARKPNFTLDVQFRAPPGVTILFGASGSGKSTTLAAIAGLARFDEGHIALGDDVWADRATGFDKPVEARGLAFVFQSLALFPHMTARANVLFGIDRKLPKDEREKVAMRNLERWRVAHLRDRLPTSFSGGEAQRVALARAFARSPRVVLLDEPFSAMDRTLRLDLGREVKAVAAELGIPFIHVTHSRREALAIGDRIVLLERGSLIREGTPEDVLPPEP